MKFNEKPDFQPIWVRKVTHQPTYCCLSSYLLNKNQSPWPDNRVPPTFISKTEIQSLKSLTRLKNAVNWMLLFADKKQVKTKIDKSQPFASGNIKTWSFRLAFITLTLSDVQIHSDEYIKEHLLQPFLYWLDRYYNCFYVWKAESQINGNIHFHLTVDQYVPWKSVRAKWNKLLAKHGYCKVNQDGSNDKGDSATQIKAVLNEKQCARDIADYVAKKDKLPTVVARGFNAIWNNDLSKINEITAAYKYLRYGKTTDFPEMLSVVAIAASNAPLYCDYDPVSHNHSNNYYKRIITGRLWGRSETLSKIKIFIEEGDHEINGEDILEYEERIFFRQNKDIYNLGKTLIRRKKLEASKKSEPERQVLCITDEDIEHKYSIFENVWIHPHLSLMKKGGYLQKLLHEAKLERKFSKQKYFIEN